MKIRELMRLGGMKNEADPPWAIRRNASLKLIKDLEAQIKTGATTAEIEAWADAYTFGRADLIEVIRVYIEWRATVRARMLDALRAIGRMRGA